ncbi:hypothetical protein EV643_108154 [Kribbella sp. VKM Ac-2527]|uniref:Uncharacterized protein n=1 Tax=Kribbella caucasensis TaxID=2512215 RepID=A0A4R6KF34_9ACTN|nr:hypothetical protein [Kribbella sp. VKM Ac-2527]TDO47840.1 hypothetical protein EV643_108154 [Kribbella sp. VKM Ac-2527]
MSTPIQQQSEADLQAQQTQAARRARAVLGVALGVVAPEAIALQDGRVRLTTSADLLERDAMERLDTRLTELAARQVSDERLVADAVALLGAEVDHARGGSSPADGATAALDQLLDVPNLPQATETEAQALLRNVLETNRLTTESATRRLAAERAAQRAADRPPLVADSIQAAQEIKREAQVLTHLAAPPALVRRGGGHRRVGGRSSGQGRTAGTRAEAGLTRDGRPQPNLTEDEALDALLQVQPNDLSGGITAPTQKLDRPKLGVVTTAHGPQYFRVDVTNPPPRRLVAQTDVRAGTLADPHVIHISPGVPNAQLPRVWANQVSRTLQQVEARAAAPANIFRRLRSALSNFRGRDATAQYDEFRLLSRQWREEQLQPAPDGDWLADLQQQLQGLATAIQRKRQPVPTLPWTTEARHVIAPDRTLMTQPATNTPAHLRERVQAEIAGLQKAVTELEKRAAAKRTSATAATALAAKTITEAETEEGRKDSAAPERGRKLRVSAASATAKAERHTTIAESCDTAVQQANEAIVAYQALLTKLDEVESSGQRPDQDVAVLAQTAADKVEAYRGGVEATLPSKEVQHAVITSGRLPHLAALTRELNQALADKKHPFRFTPEVLHRRLRAETRRMLSPDGVVITVGNDPRADVSELTQFKLHLRPGELSEVLDSPITFDEGMLGQLEQGGYSLSTTATDTLTYNGGFGLKAVMAVFPDPALLAVSQVVNPGLEYAVGQSHSVSGNATEYGLGGGVELLNGEILRYRSETPSWSWQMRTSAVAGWSDKQVVDMGDPHDNSHLDVGVGHTYTVPPPTDTVTLEQLGLAAERETELPEHVASRVDGLNDMADEAVAGLAARLDGLDRVGHDQLRGLLIEDAPSRLDETTKPGGIGRLISKGGRPVAYAQLETFVELEEVELLSDSSPDHKIERLRVGFSGASGGQAFNANSATAATIGYGGTALNDLGNSTVDFGPTVKAGRNVSREDSLNVSDVAIHPSVQRTERTVGYKIHLRHRLTIHRLDKDESFTVDGKGDAVLRMPANAAFRYGLPIPKKELVLDADDRIQRGLDGRVLTKGDPQPTEEVLKPPVWMGDGKGQLRGAGAALVQELKGADPAYKAFVRHLSEQGMVPPLDAKFRPVMKELRGKDPALVASQLENFERVGQQVARHRLETGYDLACQGGVEFALTKHRTGHPPQEHTFRIHLEQDVKRAKPLGLNTSQTATNLHIGSNTTVRSRSRSKGLPWLARFGFSDKPDKNEAGSTPDAGPTYGRSSLGRFFAWATGSTVNDVSLTESTAPLAEFEIPHKLTITEVFPDGDSEPIVEVDGSARVSIDSEFCDRGERQVVAMAGEVAPSILQTATWQHVDMGDPVPRILDQLPAAARTDSTARQHLNALLNSRNLCAHPELLTAQYGTGFAISPMPSNVEQAIAQRGLRPRQASVNLTARVENLRYVGSGHPVIGDINLTLGSSSFTAGSSSGQNIGIGGGSGAVETDGDGWNATAGLARASSTSAASTETTIGGVERLNIKDGQHYQFVGDLILVAEIKAAGLAEPKTIELPDGAVMLTMPERDALQHYGMNKDFHLPLEKVSDAVERLLDGNLSLDRRTTSALLRRYQQEKAGVTGGLAEGHTTERLRDKLHEIVKVTKPDARPANFEQVAADAEKIAKERVEARLPDHYRTTMGAALIARDEFVNADGEKTEMLAEVRAAIADRVPDALLDPAVAEALRSELGGTRWRGHIDDILDPAGYTIDYPFGDRAPEMPPPRNLQVRIRIVYDGPPSTDGAKDDPAAGKTENNFNIVQGYDYTEEGRSATTTVGYGANVGGELTQGDAGSAGLSTEASTSQTASSTEQNTRMSRALWQRTKSVERGFRLVIDVDEPPVVGADTKGVLRQRMAQRSTDQKPPLRREAAGKLTLSVPSSDINPPDVVRPEAVDHRTVPLPNYYFLRGIQLHDADGQLPDEGQTIEDQNYDDELVKAACAGLGQRDMLTAAGVQLHKATLRKQLSAATRRIAFERADGEGSPWTTALPVPGHGSRAVSVRLRADLSGLQVISDPAAGDKGQLGEVNREQGITQTTTKSTKLLPTSKTIGGKDPVTGIKGGVSFGEQVSEKDTDTTGNRNETSSFESGELVTVELQVNFHLDVRRLKYDRHNQATVTKERTIDNAATGVATLTMFRHELEAIQARMEAGLPPLQGWDPSRIAEATRRVPERRVSGHEVVPTDSGAEELHPYRPMVAALAQARRENVTVVLTMHQKDGTKQIYRAKPDGTMTGKDDNGFGAAFATLHPQLAVLAEGRVNLRELYDEGGHNGRFTGTVVKALQDKDIPASALTQLDHTLSAAKADEAEAARPDGAKQHVGRNAAGKAGTGIGVQ